MEEMTRILNAADAVRAAIGEADIGLILGSGLNDVINDIEDFRSIPYNRIPGFPQTTVPGHTGEWCTGRLSGKRVALLRGRFHYYEGHSLPDLMLPVRVMKMTGVKTVILTNAAGGVNTVFVPGDLMVISDVINYSGLNPLIGRNLDELGPRFPDMTHALAPRLRELARASAEQLGIPLREGVYMWFSGPSFETPAEIRMARLLGADAVGMSTVPEVIAARHAGMEVLGISCITNMAAGILDKPLSHKEVLETGEAVRDRFAALVLKILEAM